MNIGMRLYFAHNKTGNQVSPFPQDRATAGRQVTGVKTLLLQLIQQHELRDVVIFVITNLPEMIDKYDDRKQTQPQA